MFVYNPYLGMMGNPFYGGLNGYAQNPAYVMAPQQPQPGAGPPGVIPPHLMPVCAVLSPRTAQALLNAQPYYVQFCGYWPKKQPLEPAGWPALAEPDYSKPAVRAANGAVMIQEGSCPIGMKTAWQFGGLKLCIPIGIAG